MTTTVFDIVHAVYMTADYARMTATPGSAEIDAVVTADGYAYAVGVNADGYATGIGYVTADGEWEPVTDTVVGTPGGGVAAVVAAGVDWLATA